MRITKVELDDANLSYYTVLNLKDKSDNLGNLSKPDPIIFVLLCKYN